LLANKPVFVEEGVIGMLWHRRILCFEQRGLLGAHLWIVGTDAAVRSTVNLTVLSGRASRELAVRLTALRQNRQSADAPVGFAPSGGRLINFAQLIL